MAKCLNLQLPARKYETSTGLVHRFIPNIPQEFDCRVKPKFKQETLSKDIRIKDETYKSSQRKEYYTKSVGTFDKHYRAPQRNTVHYIRPVEEKMFREPPPPLEFRMSTMKDSFRMNYIQPADVDVPAPAKASKCILSRLGCQEQPGIPPQRKGFWKWTDPYLTTNKSDYIPYGDDVDSKIKGEILTFYNVDKFSLPPRPGNKVMFDRVVVKYVGPNKVARIPTPHVPNFGMQSEYRDHYIKQAFSDLYPYLDNDCVIFEDSLSPASRYQTMTAPGMYCTEYCNYGRRAVRTVVDPNYPKKEIKHSTGCCRLYD